VDRTFVMVRFSAALLFAAFAALMSSCAGPGAAVPPPSPDPGVDDDDDAAGGPTAPDTVDRVRVGDNLLYVGSASGAEAVDVEYDGAHVAACGGFGVRVSKLSEPGSGEFIGGSSGRCQRMAFGPILPDGTKVLYLAHHGDSWVSMPSLQTHYISPDGESLDLNHSIEDPSVQFEGLDWQDSTLYAAAHEGGVRIYETGDGGRPGLLAQVGGFENALKLQVVDDRLYVIDEDRLVVLDVTDREHPEPIGEAETLAKPRDLFVLEDRVYVALGSRGMQVFDVSDPAAPASVADVRPEGSVQAVHAEGDVVAIAAWSHVQIRDRHSLELLATERILSRLEFEQDLGVAMLDGLLTVAEWEGVHVLDFQPGPVAPDIWLTEDLFAFDGEEGGSQTVTILNRGPVVLRIDEVSTSDGAFAGEPTSLSSPAHSEAELTLTFTPPAPPGSHRLEIVSNDPDPSQATTQIHIVAFPSDRIDVGDPLTQDFAWLDPTGQEDLENLRGHVLVLAYFALF